MKNTKALGISIYLATLLEGGSIERLDSALGEDAIYSFTCDSKFSPNSTIANFDNLEKNYDDLLMSFIQLGIEDKLMNCNAHIGAENQAMTALTAIINKIKEETAHDYNIYESTKGLKEKPEEAKRITRLLDSIRYLTNLYYIVDMCSPEQNALEYALQLCDLSFGVDRLNKSTINTSITLDKLLDTLSNLEREHKENEPFYNQLKRKTNFPLHENPSKKELMNYIVAKIDKYNAEKAFFDDQDIPDEEYSDPRNDDIIFMHEDEIIDNMHKNFIDKIFDILGIKNPEIGPDGYPILDDEEEYEEYTEDDEDDIEYYDVDDEDDQDNENDRNGRDR